MAIGFVLISAAPAHEHEVYNKLSKVPEIVELHPLFGEYDLIAKIKADDLSLGNQAYVETFSIYPYTGIIIAGHFFITLNN